MIEARGLTKRYGAVVAVDGLSFAARPGVVSFAYGDRGRTASWLPRSQVPPEPGGPGLLRW